MKSSRAALVLLSHRLLINLHTPIARGSSSTSSTSPVVYLGILGQNAEEEALLPLH